MQVRDKLQFFLKTTLKGKKMTISQAMRDNLYTTKQNTLVAYSGLGKLSTSGKFDLVRINKISENGASLTVCSIATTFQTSKISDGTKSAGIKPIEMEVGKPFAFDINVQAEKEDYKTKVKGPSDDIPAIKGLSLLQKKLNLETGKVYAFRGDLAAVCGDFPEEILEKIISTMFLAVEIESMDWDAVGQDAAAWKEAIALISSTEYKEPQQRAPRLSKSEQFRLNIEQIKQISVDDMLSAYLAVNRISLEDYAQNASRFEDDLNQFSYRIREAILLSL